MGPPWDRLSQLEVVCDAGPLIHLDEIACLDLFSDFSTVPSQVWAEVVRHRPTALQSPIRLHQVSVEISADPQFQVLVRALSLDIGEQAALSHMGLHPAAVLLPWPSFPG